MRRTNLKGFTLVELLIVVAIIGVLSTIGVPTYRSMVQKAKKSEAKVALGGLYTAEVAFHSEYGTYGNILPKIGFDLEGTGTGRIYAVGFPTSACAGQAVAPSLGSSGVGANLNAVYPGYFSGTGSADSVYPSQGPVIPTVCGAVNGSTSPTSFIALAGAVIGNTSNAALTDRWTITQQRALVNAADGVIK